MGVVSHPITTLSISPINAGVYPVHSNKAIASTYVSELQSIKAICLAPIMK